MKTFLFSGILAGILSLASSCDNSTGTDNDTGRIVTSGTWRVTLFTDNGNDETADFAGYVFTFLDGGSLSAVKSGVTKTGTWMFDNSSNKLIIDLGPKIDSNKPLGELTDDWKIQSAGNTEIRLTDDNPASEEFLVFTKN